MVCRNREGHQTRTFTVIIQLGIVWWISSTYLPLSLYASMDAFLSGWAEIYHFLHITIIFLHRCLELKAKEDALFRWGVLFDKMDWTPRWYLARTTRFGAILGVKQFNQDHINLSVKETCSGNVYQISYMLINCLLKWFVCLFSSMNQRIGFMILLSINHAMHKRRNAYLTVARYYSCHISKQESTISQQYPSTTGGWFHKQAILIQTEFKC